MKKFIFSTIFRLLAKGANFLLLVSVAQILQPSEFGTYGVYSSAIIIAAIISHLGLRQSCAQLVGKDKISIKYANIIYLYISPISIILCLLFTYFLSDLKNKSSYSIAVVALCAIIASYINFLQGVFLGSAKYFMSNIIDAGPKVLAAIIIVLVSNLEYNKLFTAIDILSLVALLQILFIFFVLFNLRREKNITSEKIQPIALVTDGIYYAVAIFFIAVIDRFGIFFLSIGNNIDEIHNYYGAIQINQILMELAALPGLFLFSIACREKKSAAILMTAKVIRLMILPLIFISAGIVFFSNEIVSIILGKNYSESGAIIKILGLSVLPLVVTKVIYSTISGMGSKFFGVLLYGSMLFICAISSFFAYNAIGIIGLAIGNLVAYCYSATAIVFYTSRKYEIKLTAFFIPSRKDLEFRT